MAAVTAEKGTTMLTLIRTAGQYVKLTNREAEAMRLYHLGGPEAWRTETAHVACSTINSLFRKGMFEGKDVTEFGRWVGQQCADRAHAGDYPWGRGRGNPIASAKLLSPAREAAIKLLIPRQVHAE
jgi:hypothetical protein